jgi:cyclophilin family peptidyl-prolyl cis-trans isomerase/HEAT repeat protein
MTQMTQINQGKQINLGTKERYRTSAKLPFSAFRLICVICVICGPGVLSVSSAQSELRDRLLLAEDTRPVTEAQIAVLREALNGNLRRTAIRSIGRLERADLIPLVAPALADGVGIRAEAANALAQMARTPAAVAEVQRLLIERAATDWKLETWESWGEMAAAIGRLPYESAGQVSKAEAVLVQALPAPDSFTEVEAAALVGAVRGLESLSRVSRKIGPFEPRTWELLRWAATAQRPAADPRSAITRRLAMSALVTGGQATGSVIDRGLLDSDAEVRRLTALAAGGDAPVEGREELLQRALADRDARVRWEGLRGWGRQFQKASCAPVRAALKDTDPHVRLQAVDLLGAGCPAGDPAVSDLTVLIEALSDQLQAWHMPAHAIVALARQSPAEAQKALPRFVRHPIWQVRMYAARAGGALSALSALDTLGHDKMDNVREAALAALIELKRPEAIPLAIENLTHQDYQLVLTATRALADPGAASRATRPLLTALSRITAEHKDTSRDPRMAILNRLQGYGDTGIADELGGYLRDFDPRIAEKAAEILTAWTKKPHMPAPQPLPTPRVTTATVDSLRGRSLRFSMNGGRSFDIALNVEAAPLSAARIARRAGEGYYNGLTFHRVAPNFVIQGGSPGANEYAGEALYMRDEVGLHLRGTVGISTRGRDTGDAQIFVNLVDSPRLDHFYTVFGTVVAGMDVVDGILEGDVIDHVELVGR